jgi:ERCC4-type nuclease
MDTSNQQPEIIVDTHERQSGLTALLRSQELFDVREEQLSIGEIIIGDLGIERKTGTDFISSLFDGRLFRQLILLRRCFRRRILLLEGEIPESARHCRATKGALLKIVGSLNIPIVYTADTRESAMTLQHLTLQLLVAAGGQIRERSLPDTNTKSFYQSYILAGIPGIGVARAKALLAHFGSLERVFAASPEELEKVPQIGALFAKRIAELARFQGRQNSARVADWISCKGE